MHDVRRTSLHVKKLVKIEIPFIKTINTQIILSPPETFNDIYVMVFQLHRFHLVAATIEIINVKVDP